MRRFERRDDADVVEARSLEIASSRLVAERRIDDAAIARELALAGALEVEVGSPRVVRSGLDARAYSHEATGSALEGLVA